MYSSRSARLTFRALPSFREGISPLLSLRQTEALSAWSSWQTSEGESSRELWPFWCTGAPSSRAPSLRAPSSSSSSASSNLCTAPSSPSRSSTKDSRACSRRCGVGVVVVFIRGTSSLTVIVVSLVLFLVVLRAQLAKMLLALHVLFEVCAPYLQGASQLQGGYIPAPQPPVDRSPTRFELQQCFFEPLHSTLKPFEVLNKGLQGLLEALRGWRRRSVHTRHLLLNRNRRFVGVVAVGVVRGPRAHR